MCNFQRTKFPVINFALLRQFPHSASHLYRVPLNSSFPSTARFRNNKLFEKHGLSKLNRLVKPVLRVRSKHLVTSFLHRKEVIQPQVLLRLPCYDFTPIADPTLGRFLPCGLDHDVGYCQLSWCDGRCVQGPGTYSPRHADSRLLATPASCRRVSAYNPN